MNHIVKSVCKMSCRETLHFYSKCFVDQENIWFYAFRYTSFLHICYIHKSKIPEKYPCSVRSPRDEQSAGRTVCGTNIPDDQSGTHRRRLRGQPGRAPQ